MRLLIDDNEIGVPAALPGPGWLPLAAVEKHLGMSVKSLGDGRFGLCPDPDLCVPVPPYAVSERDGRSYVRLDEIAQELGIVVESDRSRTVVTSGTGAGVASAAAAGAVVGDLTLPAVDGGEPTALATSGQRGVVFAWASW